VQADRLVRPDGVRPGDALILTKRLAVEATSIIAREKAAELADVFDAAFLQRCRRFLHAPGISVLQDALVAQSAARIHAMHDPTEGGVATALHEMALAGQVDLEIEIEAAPIYPETQQLCAHFNLDPWGVIASGSLLMAVEAAEADRVVEHLRRESIEANVIGRVLAHSDRPIVLEKPGEERRPLRTFARDEITRLF
jgi:hydrogenase expression/formation protein HypE